MRSRYCEKRSMWRSVLAALTLALAFGVAMRAPAQLSTTTVQGTIYRADGTPASGTLLVSWPAFTTPQNQAVAAGSLSATIGADGFVSVNLTPNAGALPAGSYYTVVYQLSDGTVNQEYWVVPAAGTAAVASVRAQLEPSTVAVQPTVTSQYVTSAMASMASSYLPLAGGTLSGPLTLNADPTAATQAATKHYADQIGAQSLPLSGGALGGPLTVPSLSAQQLEGMLYADQWQSSSGSNNGIAMSLQECASLPYACHVLAPALYSSVEQPAYDVWSPSQLWFEDRRSGGSLSYFHNPGNALYFPTAWPGTDSGSGGSVATGIYGQWDGHLSTYAANVSRRTLDVSNYDSTPGFSADYPGGAATWATQRALSINQVMSGEGINDGILIGSMKFGNGDHIGEYIYNQDVGGYTAYGDEAAKAFATQEDQVPYIYTGTCSSGCTTGSTQITTTPVSNSKTQGAGRPLIDTTRGATACTVTNVAVGTFGTLSAVTVSGCALPVSTAWGTTQTAVPVGGGPGVNPAPPFTISQTFNVVLTSGTVNTSTLFCIQSGPIDCGYPTVVGTASGGVQSVTVPLRRYHPSGTPWFQGGAAEDGLEFTGWTQTVSGNTMRYLWFVLGSTASNVLQVYNPQPAPATISIALSNQMTGSINLSGLSSSGTTVTAAYVPTGSTLSGATDYINTTFMIAGASDSALNAPCTNVIWTGSTALTCTIAGLSGTHTSSTATASLGLSGANVWPMAIVTDVQNESATPPQIDGTLALTPNNIVIASGDSLAEEQIIAAKFQSQTNLDNATNPYAVYNGFLQYLQGTAAQGGGGSGASNAGFIYFNENPDSYYLGLGGMWTPPNFFNINGSYNHGLNFTEGPSPSGSPLVSVSLTATQEADPNYSFPVLQVLNTAGPGGYAALSFQPRTNTFMPSGIWDFQGAVTGATINGEITVDGTVYSTLNAAWNAAVGQANATGQNQTIRLGPGIFAVSATLNEPSNGACVSVLGSGGTTMNADSTQVATTLTVPTALNGDVFFLGNAAQAQGCTFRDLNVLAQTHATHGFELQWFRGALIDNVTVNDTTAEGILLGEESTSSGHQSNFLVRNTTVSYSSAAFTPASRPAWGIHLQMTAMDSHLDDIVVRNALTAAIDNEGTGNTGYLIHGFGYPYTCTTAPCANNASSGSAANASFATNYVIYDTGGSGSVWTDTYADSPAIAGFYVGANGIAIHGGHIQWPDLTSFPAANLAYVAAAVTNNLAIADVDCLEMNASVNWITYAGTAGDPPTFASVHHLSGCGNYYQALEPAQVTGFSSGGANVADGSSAVPRVWSTPIAAAASYPAFAAQLYTGYQGDAFQAHFSGQNPFFNVTYQGTIRSSGGIALSTVINTASTLTLTAANKNVIANAASGAQILTLPSCYATLPDRASPTGLEFTIVKSDTSSNTVTLQTTSSQLIYSQGSSAQTLVLSSPSAQTLVCGTDNNWYVTGIAAASVSQGSTVTSFNGRTGAVTPGSGDYSFSQISGQATNAQLPATLTAPTTGNAATATALAATPSQCPTGYYATGITASGAANCLQSWHFTWYGYFGGSFGTSTNNSLGSVWTPSAALTMTRLDIAVGTAPAGCTTWPVVGIYDSTSSAWLKTVTLASGTYAYRNAVSGVSIIVGHNLSMGVQTAGAGCSTSPQNAQLTMEYTMNQ